MKQQEIIQSLSSALFWDVAPQQIDLDLYPAFFRQRVLEYGNWHDWKLQRSYYGLSRIVEVCRQLRTLDPVCIIHLHYFRHPKRRLQMLSFGTVAPNPGTPESIDPRTVALGAGMFG